MQWTVSRIGNQHETREYDVIYARFGSWTLQPYPGNIFVEIPNAGFVGCILGIIEANKKRSRPNHRHYLASSNRDQ